ncbi:MAG: hypothetical protein U5K37_10340 [Natrialbaceae archaeon]|nr:hypothetical protein [Natrialbaceae archaeon]
MGGVRVCPIDGLAFTTTPVVFLADVIDRHYPGRARLTELFPQAWVRTMAGLPAVTEPSIETLERTFQPAAREEIHGDATSAYHAQRSRRRLALGARAATSRLYWCTYEREAGGLRRSNDPSRYLAMLESQPGVSVEPVERENRTPPIHGRTNGIDAMLETPRIAFDRLRQAGQLEETTTLAETDGAYQELAQVLAAADLDDDLREAVKSRTAFAAGEVLRRD